MLYNESLWKNIRLWNFCRYCNQRYFIGYSRSRKILFFSIIIHFVEFPTRVLSLFYILGITVDDLNFLSNILFPILDLHYLINHPNVLRKFLFLPLPFVDLQSEQLAPKDCLFYQWKLYNLWLNPAFLPSFSSKLSRIARKKWGNISRCNKMRKIVSVCQYILVTKIYWHRKKLVVYLF